MFDKEKVDKAIRHIAESQGPGSFLIEVVRNGSSGISDMKAWSIIHDLFYLEDKPDDERFMYEGRYFAKKFNRLSVPAEVFVSDIGQVGRERFIDKVINFTKKEYSDEVDNNPHIISDITYLFEFLKTKGHHYDTIETSWEGFVGILTKAGYELSLDLIELVENLLEDGDTYDISIYELTKEMLLDPYEFHRGVHLVSEDLVNFTEVLTDGILSEVRLEDIIGIYGEETPQEIVDILQLPHYTEAEVEKMLLEICEPDLVLLDNGFEMISDKEGVRTYIHPEATVTWMPNINNFTINNRTHDLLVAISINTFVDLANKVWQATNNS